MSDNVMLEIQRALGRLESSQEALRQEMNRGLRDIKDEFSTHKQDDQRNFSSMRTTLKEQSDLRETHLNAQDVKLNGLAIVSTRLEEQDKNTKTIGRYIIGAFGALVFLVGSAVIAALSGHIKIN